MRYSALVLGTSIALGIACGPQVQAEFQVTTVGPSPSGESVSIEWDSASTLFYVLERSFDLDDWVDLTPASLGGTGSRTIWAGPLTPGRQGEYFRVTDMPADFLIDAPERDDTNRVARVRGESGAGSDVLRTLVGLGDEDGDGQRDVLFRDEVWLAPTTTVFRLRSFARDTGGGRLVQVEYGETGSTSEWFASFTSLASDAWGTTGDGLTSGQLDGMSSTNLPFVDSVASDGVYVRFPKTAVADASSITFQGNVQIVENDPLVVWYYPPLADELRELDITRVECGPGEFTVGWEDASQVSGVDSVAFYRVNWERKGDWGWLAGDGGSTGLLAPSQLSYTHSAGPGEYAVRVFGEGALGAGGTVRFSGEAVEIVVLPPPPPAGMILVPAGLFSMGDSFAEGLSNELPVHAVYVSDFFMKRSKATNQEVADVMQWARGQGLLTVSSSSVQNAQGVPRELLDLDDVHCQISYVGGNFVVDAGKEDYPCVEVSWNGAQAYCNYLSDMEGLQRCVNFADWTCDFSKNGYRLATEAEWEKAARGGASGRRFPWADADTISHSRANYYSDPALAYDVSPTNGYHSAYITGVFPYTSPVDAFPPTGYGEGLHDMAGNTGEWCWDWYSATWYGEAGATQPDTTGPATGSRRVTRGGSWTTNAYYNRCAYRADAYDTNTENDIGFRVARGI